MTKVLAKVVVNQFVKIIRHVSCKDENPQSVLLHQAKHVV